MATKYYRDKLAEGQWSQDLVAEHLCPAGLFVGNYQTREFQYRLGEIVLGMPLPA